MPCKRHYDLACDAEIMRHILADRRSGTGFPNRLAPMKWVYGLPSETVMNCREKVHPEVLSHETGRGATTVSLRPSPAGADAFRVVGNVSAHGADKLRTENEPSSIGVKAGRRLRR